MRNETFDGKEVYVGRDYGGITYEITPDLVATYIAATGDDNPWYRDQSPLGGPVAPALILHSAVYRNLDWYAALEFKYDMSVSNVAHLDPQRGGCCTSSPREASS